MAHDPRGYWFTSPLFGPEPGQDDETNPGRYGRHLATWLTVKLRDRGYDAGPAVPEDWGWSVACRKGPDRFLLACGNVEDEHTGAEASALITWHCFVVAASPVWTRVLRRNDVALALQRLDGELRAILAGESEILLTNEP